MFLLRNPEMTENNSYQLCDRRANRCGKAFLFNSEIKKAIAVIQRMISEFGLFVRVVAELETYRM